MLPKKRTIYPAGTKNQINKQTDKIVNKFPQYFNFLDINKVVNFFFSFNLLDKKYIVDSSTNFQTS